MLLTGIYVQLFVLSLTLLWFAISKRRNSLDLALKTIAIAILLMGLWLGSVWVYPPEWGLGVLVLVFICLVIWKYKRKPSDTSRWRNFVSNLPVFLIIPLGSYIGVNGYFGHGQNPDGLVIDLSTPFAETDKVCVLSGGLNSFVNQHNFESDSKADYGQLYGLDVMGAGNNGFRTRRGHTLDPKPNDYKAYTIYGIPLHAPCDGRVAWAENNRIEQPIGTADKEFTSGNGVILTCGNVHVKLAHMQKGSVLVLKGDLVKSGQPIGRVGNSGNTEEPHLHIHAETVVEAGNPWSHGEPVHMRFNGRLMARGDCF